MTERLAVLDFDPTTGALAQGTRFDLTGGTYDVSPDAVESPDFLRTNAFATVLKTMYVFEEDDTLGRPLHWGFDGPQLLVVPVAGEWANAFYEREARCLQFFYFKSKEGSGTLRKAVLDQTEGSIAPSTPRGRPGILQEPRTVRLARSTDGKAKARSGDDQRRGLRVQARLDLQAARPLSHTSRRLRTAASRDR